MSLSSLLCSISVLSKVRVTLTDTVVRLEHQPEGSPKGVALELRIKRSGPGCSKLTTSLVNVSLKFRMLIFEICQYFFVEKKCEKLLQCKSFSYFFQQKKSVYLVIKS